MTTKRQKSFELTEYALDLIDRLALLTKTNENAIVELGIRLVARQEGIELRSTGNNSSSDTKHGD